MGDESQRVRTDVSEQGLHRFADELRRLSGLPFTAADIGGLLNVKLAELARAKMRDEG